MAEITAMPPYFASLIFQGCPQWNHSVHSDQKAWKSVLVQLLHDAWSSNKCWQLQIILQVVNEVPALMESESLALCSYFIQHNTCPVHLIILDLIILKVQCEEFEEILPVLDFPLLFSVSKRSVFPSETSYTTSQAIERQ
jgi:hypothetical protein